MSTGHARLLLLAIGALGLLIAPPGIWGQQEPDNSVATAAKKARDDKSSPGHISARKVFNEETSTKPNWSKRSNNYWATIPPATLSISAPNPVLRTQGDSPDPYGAYILFGETIWSDSFNQAASEYLTMLLTRSRYRGAVLTIGSIEESSINGQRSLLVHFKFDFRGIPHQGIALFVSAPEQIMSLGCMYRDIDWEKASPTCEEVLNSADVQIPSEYKPFKKPH
jgi:hypothetical protein